MQGHQRQPAVTVPAVDVGHQGDVVEKLAQGVAHAALRPLGELLRGGEELAQVLEPRLGLRVVLAIEIGVGRRLEQAVEEGRQRQLLGRLAQPDDQLAEVDQRRGAALRVAAVLDLLQSRPNGAAQLLRLGQQQPPGRLADAARRLVQYPQERQVVARVPEQAQIGHQVLDLGALVEAHAADQLVGQAAPHHLLFESARLGVGAHQDGGLRQRRVRQLLEGGHQPARLVALVAAAVELWRLATLELGPQPLGAAPLVVLDKRRGGVENRLRRAVVALQLPHRGTLEVALELEYVVQLGAAPAVDALVLVAHRGEVAVVADHLVNQPHLGVVGVLELVDQQVGDAAAQALAHLLFFVEQPHGEAQHVVEVDRRGVAQQGLVATVDRRHLALVEAARRGLVLARPDEAVLGAADRGEHLAWLERAFGDALLLEGLLDGGDLVVAVEDDKAGWYADAGAPAAQQAEGEAVKGADEAGQRRDAQQALDALLHLAGRLVGEGDGHHCFGRHAQLAHQPGDAIGDDARLARAGPGQDELRPAAVGHGGELLRIQVGFEVETGPHHSTVTLLARLRGWSTSAPRRTAT